MCGICGFTGDRHSSDADSIIARMTESLAHRGPDEDGFFVGDGVRLGHRRLSIIDIAGGRQPLFSEDRGIAVVCNGEIYNHSELRAELLERGHRLSSGSDCEVIAHLWEDLGTAMLSRLDGMFAIALWDSRRHELLLARDRMGKKPLFWSATGGGVVFGSELRALLAHPDVPRRVCPDSLYRFLTLDYVPTPYSIIEGVFKVESGGWILSGSDGITSGRFHELRPGATFDGNEQDAAEAVWEELVRATGRRLESEVPLGVFLSGGLDSCSVLAAMCRHVDPSEISTFTIAFDDPSFDESEAARSVARHFGTRHHEHRLDGEQAVRLVGETASIADEPLADYSIIPTALLARFAKEHISVALSGDGGDELFYGYETFKADRLARIATRLLPGFVTDRILPAAASAIPVTDRNMGLDYKVDRMSRGLRYDRFGRHLAWVGGFNPRSVRGGGGVLNKSTSDAMSIGEEDWWPDVARVLAGTEHMDPFKRLAIMYMRLYLQDGVLVKVDRASMNCALEVRSPFLDTAMVKLALSMPASLNLHGGATKAVIRRMIRGRVPERIVSAPKKGFGVPVAAWLRSDLRPMIDRLLSREYLARQDIFNPSAVEAMVRSHMERRHNFRKELFSLLIFQLWHEQWICK